MSDATAEKKKHHLAMKLEKEKWSTRQIELRFLEAGQHIRSLNGFLWQIPGMAIAITGGIWYGAMQLTSYGPKIAVLLFVGIFNLVTIAVLIRLRSLIAAELAIQNNSFYIHRFEIPNANASWFEKYTGFLNRSYIVITCWSTLLLLAASLSFIGAYYHPFIKKNDDAKDEGLLKSIKEAQLLTQVELQAQKRMLEQVNSRLPTNVKATPSGTNH